jgi:3-oxoacyl-[acyl-carrier protein] reductase
VIGASAGIGRATADLLSSRGSHVVYSSRRLSLLQEIVSDKSNSHAIQIDIESPDSLERGIDEASKLLNGLDLVVYAPGYFGDDCFGTFEELFKSGEFSSGYENSFKYHLEGMLQAFEHSRKHLIQSTRGGVFVTISSIAGSIGHNGSVLYAMSKAAADAAVRQLALEYASYPLRVLSVAPGECFYRCFFHREGTQDSLFCII